MLNVQFVVVVFSAVVVLTLSADVKSPICQEEMARYNRCFPHVETDIKEVIVKAMVGGIDHASLLNITKRSREGLKCFGNVTCGEPLYVKYIMEASIFAEDKLYLGAFECMKKNPIDQNVKICAAKHVPQDSAISDEKVILSYLTDITKCTAEILDDKVCNTTEKNNYLQGSLVITDIGKMTFGMPMDSKGRVIYDGFNKTFNPEGYLSIHL